MDEVLSPFEEENEIFYREQAIHDFLDISDVVNSLYYVYTIATRSVILFGIYFKNAKLIRFCFISPLIDMTVSIVYLNAAYFSPAGKEKPEVAMFSD